MDRRSRWRTSDRGGKEMWWRTMAGERASERERTSPCRLVFGINTQSGPTPVKAEVARVSVALKAGGRGED